MGAGGLDIPTPFSGSPALVTGGAGFIGSHLVERLVGAGGRITVLDNLQSGRWSNLAAVAGDFHAVEGDVRSLETVESVVRDVKPEYIFHLAANASVPGSVDDPVYDFESNCPGTFNVLNAARIASSCKRVVCVSSGAVYGEPRSFPIREDDLLSPISPYGASKLAAEVQARMFERVYGTPAVIARLFNAFGPRMARFVVLDFLKKLRANPNRLEILGTGQQVRDFTYVADTVQGLMLLASDGAPCEAYNVSSGSTCSVTELAKQLIDVLGLSGRTELTFTGKSWVGDAQRWEVSIDKLAAIGYRPAYSLADGLRSTSDWFARAEPPGPQ